MRVVFLGTAKVNVLWNDMLLPQKISHLETLSQDQWLWKYERAVAWVCDNEEFETHACHTVATLVWFYLLTLDERTTIYKESSIYWKYFLVFLESVVLWFTNISWTFYILDDAVGSMFAYACYENWCLFNWEFRVRQKVGQWIIIYGKIGFVRCEINSIILWHRQCGLDIHEKNS